MNIRYTSPSPMEYISLRLRTGMGEKDLIKSEIALKNSLFIVSLWDNNDLIGFGRVVGDKMTFVEIDIGESKIKRYF